MLGMYLGLLGLRLIHERKGRGFLGIVQISNVLIVILLSL